MKLESPSFAAGAPIPRKHACEGEDVSPQLLWSGVPAGTKAFALVMDDPDAPPGTWVHWVLYDLPGHCQGLEEGCPKLPSLGNGARHGLCWGVDSFDRLGYFGPCPPPGKPHRYSFRLYALKAPVGLGPRATKAQLEEAMKGGVLGQAELVGTYQR